MWSKLITQLTIDSRRQSGHAVPAKKHRLRLMGFSLTMVIITMLSTTVSSAQPVLRQDSTALVELYNITNGEAWHNNSGWLKEPVSEWYGVEVVEVIDGDRRITELNLQSNNLNGFIIDFFFINQMSHLKVLNLNDNKLHSSFEWVLESLFEGFMDMPNLEVLKLSGNKGLEGIPHMIIDHSGLNVFWFEDTHIYEFDYDEERLQNWMESLEDERSSGLTEGAPIVPIISNPADQTVNVPLPVTFRWEEVTVESFMFHNAFVDPADSFRVQVALDEAFEQVQVDTVLTDTLLTLDYPLEFEQNYYWRVQARNEVSPGIWTYGSQFTTMEEVEMTVTEKTFDGPVTAGASMIGEDILVLPVSGEALYSLDASLQERFSLSVGGELLATSSIAYDSSFYIGSTDNTLYAFNKNGAPMWNAAVGGQVTATPAVDSVSGAVYIGVENRNVIALDRKSGAARWSFFASSPVRHSPVVSTNRIMLVASSEGTVYGLDLESTGEPPHLWEHDLDTEITANLSLGLPGHAYAVTGSNELVSLHFDRQGASEAWRVVFDGALSSSPVIDAGNHLYVADGQGVVTKLDAETGDELWTLTLANPVFSTPALGDDRLYVADRQGVIYSIDPDQGSVNWQFSFTENPSRALLYAGGSLYIGSQSGKVIRVHDPAEEGPAGEDQVAGGNGGDLIHGDGLMSGKKSGNDRMAAEAGGGSPLWGSDMGNNRRTGVQSPDQWDTSTDDPGRESTPTEFELAQNYPNPFNPATQIRYSIPQQTHVRLDVFDALGRRVATLVNESKSPGRYDVTFDAGGLSSGLYMYRLQTASHTESRQMLLVR